MSLLDSDGPINYSYKMETLTELIVQSSIFCRKKPIREKFIHCTWNFHIFVFIRVPLRCREAVCASYSSRMKTLETGVTCGTGTIRCDRGERGATRCKRWQERNWAWGKSGSGFQSRKDPAPGILDARVLNFVEKRFKQLSVAENLSPLIQALSSPRQCVVGLGLQHLNSLYRKKSCIKFWCAWPVMSWVNTTMGNWRIRETIFCLNINFGEARILFKNHVL